MPNRVITYPTVAARNPSRSPERITEFPIDARIGYNVGSVWNSTPDLDVAVNVLKGTILRAGSSAAWTTIEDYYTGEVSLPNAAYTWLDYCAAKGVDALFVLAYEPPRIQVGTLTLTTAATAGSYVLKVSGMDLSTLDLTRDYVARNTSGSGRFISDRTSYAGTYLDELGTNAGDTITLASALNVNLAAGTVLVVNRQKYPPIRSDQSDPGAVSPQAFDRVALAVAKIMASRGVTGYVQLQNEPPWSASCWTSGNRLYDRSGQLQDDDPDPGMVPILRAALQRSGELPPGIRYINGGSDKNPGRGILRTPAITPDITDDRIRNTVAVDSIHPYDASSPWSVLWDPTDVPNSPVRYRSMNRRDQSKPHMSWSKTSDDTRAAGSVAPARFATEFGITVANGTTEEDQARLTVARVAAMWGCSVLPIVYGLRVDGSYTLIRDDGTLKPVALALQRLMNAVETVAGGGVGRCPDLVQAVGYPSATEPPVITGVNGSAGHLLLVAAKPEPITDSATPTRYTSASRPAPRPIQIAVAPETTLNEITDVVTGLPVPYTRVGALITFQITDSLVMVRTSL